MRPLEEVQRQILETVSPLPVAQVPLHEAFGLVLAQSVEAPHDVPPFANSAMDGYAVRAADLVEAPIVLEVLEDLPAGRVGQAKVEPGTAVRIMTGAPLPEGADAVVRVEDTARRDGQVEILVAVGPGTSIRPAGGDVRAGSEVLAAGERLLAAHLGVLASLGIAAPRVRRRPRVAVLSTGDELVDAGPTLQPGQIRDSNRPILMASLDELEAETIDFGILGDDPDRLLATLREAAESADAVVSSGGVSMGDYDVVKAALRSREIAFWQVAMQPAKPLGFGLLDGTPFFGLPGNPVSVMVAFEQFVRPALLRMMGARRLFRPRVTGRAAELIETDPAKTVFVRVIAEFREGGWLAAPSGGQASNVLSALAHANAFLVVPEGVGSVEAGEPVELEMYRWPETRSFEDVLNG